MEKALEILKHLDELYVEQPDFSKLEKMAQNNPERVQAWEDAFREYDLVDVLNAIDEFWNFKSSKSKPSVHQIRAMLTSKKDVEKVVGRANVEPMTDYAVAFMQRDIQTGSNRHLLPVYQKAVRYIAEDMLAKEIAFEEWKGLNFGERCERAMQVGLFNHFDDVLVSTCHKYYGKDYQYDSASMLNARKVNYDYDRADGDLANKFKM